MATKPFGASWWPNGCPKPGTAAWDKLPWPDNVPVLAVKDVAKQHEIPSVQPPYNIDGWLEATFPEGTDKKSRWVSLIAMIALETVIAAKTKKVLASWEYSLEKGVTPADLAAAWNEMLALLGYDAGTTVPDEEEDYFK